MTILEILYTAENVDKQLGTLNLIVDMFMSGVQMDGILNGTADMLGNAIGAVGIGAKK
jgi:hypothetical protein